MFHVNNQAHSEEHPIISEMHTDRRRPDLHTKPKAKSTRAPGLAIEHASRRRLSMQLDVIDDAFHFHTVTHALHVHDVSAQVPGKILRRLGDPLYPQSGQNHRWSSLGELPACTRCLAHATNRTGAHQKPSHCVGHLRCNLGDFYAYGLAPELDLG